MKEETVDPILYATAQHLIIPSRHPMCFSGAYGPSTTADFLPTDWSGQYWNAPNASYHDWHAEGSGIRIDEAFDAFFAAIGTAFAPLVEAVKAVFSSAWEALSSMAWPMDLLKLPRRDSKQTRAYYRVRARVQERQKVRVQAHPRRHRRGR